MIKKAVVFGDLILRLTPPLYDRFIQTDIFKCVYTGAEANVAVSLSNFGIAASVVTAVPNHEIGSAAINMLRRYGVDTKYIVRGDGRIGLFYLEKGASQRPSKIIYDRQDTVFTNTSPNCYDWETIFEGADWFHYTGITPALSENVANALMQAVKTAKKMGLTVSCDLNYRAKLWSREDARKTMTKLSAYTDICISNEEDAFDVYGIQAEGSNVHKGELSREGYADVGKRLCEKIGYKKAAITLRKSFNASENGWSAMLFDGKNAHFGKEYLIKIVDRVGGGDSFSGGLIYGFLSGMEDREALDFAIASSCLKQCTEGDFNLSSIDEVKKLCDGDGSGRVQR